MSQKKALIAYSKRVIEGKVVAGWYHQLACKRFLSDCEREDLFFDEDEAERILKFCSFLRHWEGQWRGKVIELTDFQKFVVFNIMCWKKDGKRKHTSIYIQLGRKNAKTTLVAVMALYHLMASDESTPQILVGANNEDQAKICVNTVGQICKVSPELQKLIEAKELRLYEYKAKVVGISYRSGVVEAMSKNADTKDGFNPSLGIIDEYHEAKNDKLLNVIESGQGARHPFMVCITTAGFNKEGPCYANLRNQSIKILEGHLEDDRHFSLICEPDEEDDWKDEKTWVKSNPLMTDIETLEPFLQSRFIKAKNEGGTKEVDFITKNLNKWTNASTVWIKDEDYRQCEVSPFGLERFEGKPVWLGLDLSATTDLTSLAIGCEIDGVMEVLVWSWCPETKLESNEFDYLRAQQNGWVFISDGDVVDYRDMADKLLDVLELCDVRSIGYDIMIFNQTIRQLLPSDDIPFRSVPQKATQMHRPTELLFGMVTETARHNRGEVKKNGEEYRERIRFSENGLLRWCFSNVEIFRNHEGMGKPTKSGDKKSQKTRIDPVDAIIDMLYVWDDEDEDIFKASDIL